MALAVALLILCDGLHHGDLSVHRFMIMQTVAMHSELYVHSVWLVDGKCAVCVAVIGDSELLLDIFEGHDVCDCSLIEPYFSSDKVVFSIISLYIYKYLVIE